MNTQWLLKPFSEWHRHTHTEVSRVRRQRAGGVRVRVTVEVGGGKALHAFQLDNRPETAGACVRSPSGA